MSEQMRLAEVEVAYIANLDKLREQLGMIRQEAEVLGGKYAKALEEAFRGKSIFSALEDLNKQLAAISSEGGQKAATSFTEAFSYTAQKAARGVMSAFEQELAKLKKQAGDALKIDLADGKSTPQSMLTYWRTYGQLIEENRVRLEELGEASAKVGQRLRAEENRVQFGIRDALKQDKQAMTQIGQEIIEAADKVFNQIKDRVMKSSTPFKEVRAEMQALEGKALELQKALEKKPPSAVMQDLQNELKQTATAMENMRKQFATNLFDAASQRGIQAFGETMTRTMDIASDSTTRTVGAIKAQIASLEVSLVDFENKRKITTFSPLAAGMTREELGKLRTSLVEAQMNQIQNETRTANQMFPHQLLGNLTEAEAKLRQLAASAVEMGAGKSALRGIAEELDKIQRLTNEARMQQETVLAGGQVRTMADDLQRLRGLMQQYKIEMATTDLLPGVKSEWLQHNIAAVNEIKSAWREGTLVWKEADMLLDKLGVSLTKVDAGVRMAVSIQDLRKELDALTNGVNAHKIASGNMAEGYAKHAQFLDNVRSRLIAVQDLYEKGSQQYALVEAKIEQIDRQRLDTLARREQAQRKLDEAAKANDEAQRLEAQRQAAERLTAQLTNLAAMAKQARGELALEPDRLAPVLAMLRNDYRDLAVEMRSSGHALQSFKDMATQAEASAAALDGEIRKLQRTGTLEGVMLTAKERFSQSFRETGDMVASLTAQIMHLKHAAQELGEVNPGSKLVQSIDRASVSLMRELVQSVTQPVEFPKIKGLTEPIQIEKLSEASAKLRDMRALFDSVPEGARLLSDALNMLQNRIAGFNLTPAQIQADNFALSLARIEKEYTTLRTTMPNGVNEQRTALSYLVGEYEKLAQQTEWNAAQQKQLATLLRSTNEQMLKVGFKDQMGTALAEADAAFSRVFKDTGDRLQAFDAKLGTLRLHLELLGQTADADQGKIRAMADELSRIAVNNIRMEFLDVLSRVPAGADRTAASLTDVAETAKLLQNRLFELSGTYTMGEKAAAAYEQTMGLLGNSINRFNAQAAAQSDKELTAAARARMDELRAAHRIEQAGTGTVNQQFANAQNFVSLLERQEAALTKTADATDLYRRMVALANEEVARLSVSVAKDAQVQAEARAQMRLASLRADYQVMQAGTDTTGQKLVNAQNFVKVLEQEAAQYQNLERAGRDYQNLLALLAKDQAAFATAVTREAEAAATARARQQLGDLRSTYKIEQAGTGTTGQQLVNAQNLLQILERTAGEYRATEEAARAYANMVSLLSEDIARLSNKMREQAELDALSRQRKTAIDQLTIDRHIAGQDVNAQVEALRRYQQALEQMAKQAGLTAAQQERLARDIATVEKSINGLANQAMHQAIQRAKDWLSEQVKMGMSAQEQTRVVDQWALRVQELARQYGHLGEAARQAIAGMDHLAQQRIGSVNRQERGDWGSAMMDFGMATMGTGAIVATSTNKFKEFDQAMANVNSLIKESTAGLSKYTDEVMRMSSGHDIAKSPQELATALYDVVSAGWKGREALDLLEQSARGATAGLANTTQTVQLVSGILHAYEGQNLTASHVMNVLFHTVDKGILRFSDLASHMGTVVQSSAMMGVSIEDLGAMMTVLTRRGLTPAIAFTALNNALLSLANPSEQASIEAERLGLSWFKAGQAIDHLKAVGLPNVLQEIAQATGGAADKVQMLFPNIRSLRAAAALVADGGKDILRWSEDFKASAGSLDEALEKQAEGFEHKVQKMTAAWDRFLISLGRSNAVLGGVEMLTHALHDLNDVPDTLKAIGITATTVVGALSSMAMTLSMVGFGAAGLRQLSQGGQMAQRLGTMGMTAGRLGLYGALGLAAAGTAYAIYDRSNHFGFGGGYQDRREKDRQAELREEEKRTNDAYLRSAEANRAKQESVERLVSKIEDLRRKIAAEKDETKRATMEKQAFKQTVDDFNAIAPNLHLNLDKSTDKLGEMAKAARKLSADFKDAADNFDVLAGKNFDEAERLMDKLDKLRGHPDFGAGEGLSAAQRADIAKQAFGFLNSINPQMGPIRYSGPAEQVTAFNNLPPEVQKFLEEKVGYNPRAGIGQVKSGTFLNPAQQQEYLRGLQAEQGGNQLDAEAEKEAIRKARLQRRWQARVSELMGPGKNMTQVLAEQQASKELDFTPEGSSGYWSMGNFRVTSERVLNSIFSGVTDSTGKPVTLAQKAEDLKRLHRAGRMTDEQLDKQLEDVKARFDSELERYLKQPLANFDLDTAIQAQLNKIYGRFQQSYSRGGSGGADREHAQRVRDYRGVVNAIRKDIESDTSLTWEQQASEIRELDQLVSKHQPVYVDSEGRGVRPRMMGQNGIWAPFRGQSAVTSLFDDTRTRRDAQGRPYIGKHYGLDFARPKGSEVTSPVAQGIVQSVGMVAAEDGGGGHVVIKLPDGKLVHINHVNLQNWVKAGAQVTASSTLGTVFKDHVDMKAQDGRGQWVPLENLLQGYQGRIRRGTQVVGRGVPAVSGLTAVPFDSDPGVLAGIHADAMASERQRYPKLAAEVMTQIKDDLAQYEHDFLMRWGREMSAAEKRIKFDALLDQYRKASPDLQRALAEPGIQRQISGSNRQFLNEDQRQRFELQNRMRKESEQAVISSTLNEMERTATEYDARKRERDTEKTRALSLYPILGVSPEVAEQNKKEREKIEEHYRQVDLAAWSEHYRKLEDLVNSREETIAGLTVEHRKAVAEQTGDIMDKTLATMAAYNLEMMRLRHQEDKMLETAAPGEQETIRGLFAQRRTDVAKSFRQQLRAQSGELGDTLTSMMEDIVKKGAPTLRNQMEIVLNDLGTMMGRFWATLWQEGRTGWDKFVEITREGGVQLVATVAQIMGQIYAYQIAKGVIAKLNPDADLGGNQQPTSIGGDLVNSSMRQVFDSVLGGAMSKRPGGVPDISFSPDVTRPLQVPELFPSIVPKMPWETAPALTGELAPGALSAAVPADQALGALAGSLWEATAALAPFAAALVGVGGLLTILGSGANNAFLSTYFEGGAAGAQHSEEARKRGWANWLKPGEMEWFGRAVDAERTNSAVNMGGGTAAGALAGAGIGTIILPGVGTAIGAVIGTIAGMITGAVAEAADFNPLGSSAEKRFGATDQLINRMSKTYGAMTEDDRHQALMANLSQRIADDITVIQDTTKSAEEHGKAEADVTEALQQYNAELRRHTATKFRELWNLGKFGGGETKFDEAIKANLQGDMQLNRDNRSKLANLTEIMQAGGTAINPLSGRAYTSMAELQADIDKFDKDYVELENRMKENEGAAARRRRAGNKNYAQWAFEAGISTSDELGQALVQNAQEAFDKAKSDYQQVLADYQGYDPETTMVVVDGKMMLLKDVPGYVEEAKQELTKAKNEKWWKSAEFARDNRKEYYTRQTDSNVMTYAQMGEMERANLAIDAEYNMRKRREAIEAGDMETATQFEQKFFDTVKQIRDSAFKQVSTQIQQRRDAEVAAANDVMKTVDMQIERQEKLGKTLTPDLVKQKAEAMRQGLLAQARAISIELTKPNLSADEQKKLRSELHMLETQYIYAESDLRLELGKKWIDQRLQLLTLEQQHLDYLRDTSQISEDQALWSATGTENQFGPQGITVRQGALGEAIRKQGIELGDKAMIAQGEGVVAAAAKAYYEYALKTRGAMKAEANAEFKQLVSQITVPTDELKEILSPANADDITQAWKSATAPTQTYSDLVSSIGRQMVTAGQYAGMMRDALNAAFTNINNGPITSLKDSLQNILNQQARITAVSYSTGTSGTSAVPNSAGTPSYPSQGGGYTWSSGTGYVYNANMPDGMVYNLDTGFYDYLTVPSYSGGGGGGSYVPPAGDFHTGGIIPRYHSGGRIAKWLLSDLKPGEVPIVALEGEEMLTEDDPRHIKNIGQQQSDTAVRSMVNMTNISNTINNKPTINVNMAGAYIHEGFNTQKFARELSDEITFGGLIR